MVFVVLALLLRLRLAFWVALGVPTSFLGAIAVMPLLGISINWISLLGFLIVLGILVDDAIVVGENTYSEQRLSANKLEGAIRGAQGIAVPVVFGVLTTVAAFAPMLFIPGAMGRLVIGMPLVVIACLFSLFRPCSSCGAPRRAARRPPIRHLEAWRGSRPRRRASRRRRARFRRRPRSPARRRARGDAGGSGWRRFVFRSR
jgi:predicted RND superfamily exporter protein